MTNQVRVMEADRSIADTGPESIMAVISRAASDPATNVDKLERLMAMYERITERNAKASYAAALAALQPELPVIVERGKIDLGKGKPQLYALWEDINEAIKPILAKHGFALSFRTGADDGKITVTGILSHRDGHSEQTTIYLPADTSGSKNAVQAVGSSTSYGKRYTAAALLNLTSRGEDDDGVAAGRGQLVSDDQVSSLIELIESVNADRNKFCSFFKIEKLSDLPERRFDEAVQLLQAKVRR